MTIDLSQIKENSMVRYGFKILLMREFDIHIKENDYNRLIAAAGCIEIYDSMEEFLEKSGWKRDNPELGEKSYLLDNHICRYIQGKVWYFSRLRLREPSVGKKKSNCFIKLLIFTINRANMKKHNLFLSFNI